MYAADARHSNPDLEQKLTHLYSLRGGPAIDLTIRPAYYELLVRLGDPHKNLPPVIHVAGTNGKGSTVAMMRVICEAAGRKVHVYTSPHLKKFNERIVLAGREIPDATLESLLDEVIAATGALPLTFFEITTAMAFAAFARVPADILLLETGLGGRLDCTNVVENPLATVITPVGMDHMDYLGNSLEKIATEKAGIMKPGVPCISAPQDAAVMSVLEKRAADLGCPLVRGGQEWQAHEDRHTLVFKFHDEELVLPCPALAGAHQIVNAGTAVAALLSLQEFQFAPAELAHGLKTVHWPGRLQKMGHAALPAEWELWIDGGHNGHAAQALAVQARLWQEQDGKRLHLITAMLDSRDPLLFLTPLLPHCASITVTSIPGEPRSRNPGAVAAALTAAGYPPAQIHQAHGPQDAVRILSRLHPHGRILAAGSLYLIGNFLP